MKILLVLALAFSIQSLAGQQTIAISDFQSLNNTSWKGNLMYVNYGDGKEVQLRTTMQIKVKGNKIIRSIQYTDEPSANSESNIIISKDGRYLGKESVVEKIIEKNGDMQLVTRLEGKDNNRPAIMTMTYVITDTTFSVTKKVSYKDSEEVLIRNKFSYSKL